MQRCLSLLPAIVILVVVSSCTPIVSDTTEYLTIIPSVLVDSDWFLRDIKSFEENKLLRLLSLSRKSATLFELYIEGFTANLESETYNFKDRYYLEFTVEERESRIISTITGIKNQSHESYKRLNDEGFTLLTETLGFTSFEILYYPDIDTLELILPTGEELLLFHGIAHEQSTVVELEDEGKLRKGTYQEYVYFTPMNEKYRLFFRWSFSYRNEEGSNVTSSNIFDAYGSRTYDDSHEGYLCEIESFSNFGYPRTYYNRNKHEILYNRILGQLGFSHFYEKQNVDGRRFIEGVVDGEVFSWQMSPTPLN